MISSAIQPDTIDWSRMAVPQDDGYDSEVTLMLAETGTAGRPPYRGVPPTRPPSFSTGWSRSGRRRRMA